MSLLLFVVNLGCETAPTVVSEAPSAPPSEVVSIITIKVPSDCPHLIVDVMTTTQADITVACFSQVTRTYFSHEVEPLSCVDEDPPRETQLSLQYVQDPPLLSSVP